MDLGLKDKVAVVCGGSRGIGLAIARGLVQEGARVVLVARDSKRLKQAKAELNHNDSKSVQVKSFDLSKPQGIPFLVNQIREELGAIDILINNAGGPPPGTLEDLGEDAWSQAFDQNLKSTITFTKAVIPIMKKGGYGRIINIASQLVKEPPPTMILSNTTRAGVVAFAKSIASDLAIHKITVNTLCPGAIWTDRNRSLLELRAKEESKSFDEVTTQLTKSLPMQRMGTPEEFANVAVFLASEAASYVTGTTLSIDGGITKSLL